LSILPPTTPQPPDKFYNEVFGWQRRRIGRTGLYPSHGSGRQLSQERTASDSEIGNLHIGIFKAANARPHPKNDGVAPRELSQDGRKARVWILVGDGQSVDDILARAVERGAEILWRNHYWKEFNGYNHAFRDPWGNDIILWVKAGADPTIPENYTRE
jgi:predicted enzyme related to lactoylglutathione lyase